MLMYPQRSGVKFVRRSGKWPGSCIVMWPTGLVSPLWYANLPLFEQNGLQILVVEFEGFPL